MRKLDLVPTARGLVPGITGFFTVPNAPKERREPEIEPMERCIQALSVDGREARFASPEIRYFGVLLFGRVWNSARCPRIAPLLEHRVVEFTRNAQHFDKLAVLRARRIEPHFMQPAQLTIEARRHHNNNRQSVCHMDGIPHREPTLTSLNARPQQRRAAHCSATAAPRR